MLDVTLDGRERWLYARLAAIAVLVAVLGYLSRHVLIDDALIYARYVRNALAGEGLVFNPGEHVNALTSPLYSYLVLILARLLGGRVLVASAILSGVAMFAACGVAEVLVPFAGLLLAATGYFYTLVGMESSLFLCLLLAPMLLLRRGRENWLPTACTLLVLTRFEGAALLPFLAWEVYRRRRLPRALAYLPVAALAAVYLGLNRYWYGTVLPASASAKFGQGRSEFWGRWPFGFFDTAYQLKPEFLPTLYVVVVVVALVGPGVWRLRRGPLVGAGLPFLGVLLGFYLLFNIPGYKWYYAPFVCFAMVYACAGLPFLGRWRWLMVPLTLLSAASAGRRFWPSSSVPVSAVGATTGYPGIAEWLRTHAAPGTRVEAAEIGMLGWYCPQCDVQDILGLTSPKNAEHIAHRDVHSWLAEDRPQFIVVHVQPWGFEAVARQSPEYAPVPVDFGPVVGLWERKR